MHYYLEASCVCHIGNVRRRNEDNFYFDKKILRMEHTGFTTPLYQCFEDDECFGVFDGLGGHADGQIASFLAALSFQKDCDTKGKKQMLSESFFQNAVRHMNQMVCNEAGIRASNMGTTVVLMGICEQRVFVCNVGDSRAYRYRNGNLTQISLDHSEPIPPFLASSSHGKTILTQCVGTPLEERLLEPYLTQGTIKNEDIFVLCTDGFYNSVSNEDITSVFSKNFDIKKAAQLLLNKALEQSGKDNITLILVRVIQRT